MNRTRDFQPTVERARGQAERAQRKLSRAYEKADDHHREMLRATAAARIANEEADALRDRNAALEQSCRALRRENWTLRVERDATHEKWVSITRELERLAEWAELPLWRRSWRRLREWVREAMRIGAEA